MTSLEGEEEDTEAGTEEPEEEAMKTEEGLIRLEEKAEVKAEAKEEEREEEVMARVTEEAETNSISNTEEEERRELKKWHCQIRGKNQHLQQENKNERLIYNDNSFIKYILQALSKSHFW